MKNKKFSEYFKVALVIALLYFFYNLVGIGCPIKWLTGISCAGCGMTRAWICFVHLDIKGAIYYHPLFILPPFYLFLFLMKDQISYKLFYYLIVIAIVLFSTIYIIRLLNPEDIVVSINLKNGFIYKFFNWGWLNG
jgi:hypothetical protein